MDSLWNWSYDLGILGLPHGVERKVLLVDSGTPLQGSAKRELPGGGCKVLQRVTTILRTQSLGSGPSAEPPTVSPLALLAPRSGFLPRARVFRSAVHSVPLGMLESSLLQPLRH